MLEPLPSTPFVSAFGLTFNHEDYIAESIESVLSQGWPADRFEYVLVDDGSTDATPERVKPYLNHITYIRQENQGIHRAANRVIGLLRGDVMVPCSGDDTWPLDRLERAVGRLQDRPDVGFTYGDMEVIDGRGKVIAPSFVRASKFTPHDGQIAGKLLSGNFVSGGSMTIRAALRPVILPIPLVAAWEDWWIAWALTNVAPVDYVDAPVYRYRQHGGNFVFGVTDTATLLDRLTQEVRFRRFMLGTVRAGTSSLADLLAGADGLTGLLATLSSHGRALEPILGLTDAHRAAAKRLAADAAAAAGRAPLLAALLATRAVATDPTDQAAYRVLHSVAGHPNAPSTPFFDDVRTVTVFADLEELVADPALLGAYTDAFGSADDVTLVAVARTWSEERLAAELAPIAERFSGPDPPDILAAPFNPSAWASALTRADCLLGLASLPIPGVPRFTDAAALRAHVEFRWRFPTA